MKEDATLDCAWSERELTVKRVSEARLPTEVGEFRIAGYRSKTSAEEFVVLFKDSSLVLFLGVTLEERELSKFGRDLASTTANSTPILVAGLCYLLVTVPLGFVVRRMEAKAQEAVK